MTRLRISLYTDEDVPVQVSKQLSCQGYDVLSCRDAGNMAQSLEDEWQLRFATSQGRAILVHNIGDFIALNRQWRQQGYEHCGIILAPSITPIGELVQRTKHHLDTITASEQYNSVLFLRSE